MRYRTVVKTTKRDKQVSIKYRQLYQFFYVNMLSTNQYDNLLLLNDLGSVRSHITSVVFQIQRFDFEFLTAIW
jgi:hypothetical protein